MRNMPLSLIKELADSSNLAKQQLMVNWTHMKEDSLLVT